MIESINILKFIQNIDGKLKQDGLNTSLPILLKILSKESEGKYLVQLGKLVLKTSSSKDLQIGANYLAQVSKSKDGLSISNLILQPKMLESLNQAKLTFESKDLYALLKDAKSKGENLDSLVKDFLLNNIARTNDKDSFMEMANMLLALQQGVLSFVIKEQSKKILLQVRKQVEFLEFYSLFGNLGEISGKVYLDPLLSVNLSVMSEKIKDLLLENLSSLKGFYNVDIGVAKSSALWDLSKISSNKLLNLKG